MTESTEPAPEKAKRQAPPSRNLLNLPSAAGVVCLTLSFLASVVLPSVGPVVQDRLQTPVDESCCDYWYNENSEIPSQNTSQLFVEDYVAETKQIAPGLAGAGVLFLLLGAGVAWNAHNAEQ